jgi:hypothetical protein
MKKGSNCMLLDPFVLSYGGALWTLVQVHTNGVCYLGASSCVSSPKPANSINLTLGKFN